MLAATRESEDWQTETCSVISRRNWFRKTYPAESLEHFSFCYRLPCPIHFTFFVKWVGNHEITPFRVFLRKEWDTDKIPVYPISENAHFKNRRGAPRQSVTCRQGLEVQRHSLFF
jgi:hypothetical protein